MTVAKDRVVSINYTLTDEEGQVLDSSEGREPLAFIQGVGAIIPGLEQALEGCEQGESISVSLAPEEAYGEYNDELIVNVPKDRFPEPDQLEVGGQVQAQTADGGVQILTVAEIAEQEVTLDANHPLAGQELHFEVSIENVREATGEELDHGHVHDDHDHDGREH